MQYSHPQGIFVSVNESKPMYLRNNGQVLAIADLEGRALVAFVELVPALWHGNQPPALYKNLMDSTDLMPPLTINLPAGKKLTLADLTECRDTSGLRYWLFVFPKTREEFRRWRGKYY